MKLTRAAFTVALGLGILAAPLVAAAQSAGKVWRIGCLWGIASDPPMMEAFRQGLRELGYVEGRNLSIEWRFAEGREGRLAGLANDLVTLNVDVIVTIAPSAALAAQKATSKIPVVFAFVSADPVGLGLVRTLARPGGNVTGLANLADEMTAKRIELLKEAVPSLKSVVFLTSPVNPGYASAAQQGEAAARKVGLEARSIVVRAPGELESAVTTAGQRHAGAVVLMADSFIFTYRSQIIELATIRRLPVVGWQNRLAESGALFSYGPNAADISRRAATYVDRILKGAKPGDLPIEQPTTFELVINLKTAKALGLTIPPAVLTRADRVIE